MMALHFFHIPVGKRVFRPTKIEIFTHKINKLFLTFKT